MIRKHLALTGSFLALGLAAWTAGAQDAPKPKTTSETIGEKFDSAVKSVKRGAQEAGETLQQQFERARTQVHNMGVSGRVYGRLHWDKDLDQARTKINIDVAENGVTTLTGSVVDARAKAKAVMLTQDTVGVTQVIDRLTLASADDSTPAGSTTTGKETKVEVKKP